MVHGEAMERIKVCELFVAHGEDEGGYGANQVSLRWTASWKESFTEMVDLWNADES